MTSKDLAEQIRNNTRVILPNFGAFLQKRNEKGTFNANNITFSPFLRYNDGVLENHIAKIKGISIDQAAKEVLALTDEIARSIATTKSYKIEDLGFLIQDQNRNIQFITNLDENLKHNTKIGDTTESIDTTKFDIKPAPTSDIIEFHDDNTKSAIINKTQVADDDKTDYVLNNPQELQIKDKPKVPQEDSFTVVSQTKTSSNRPLNNQSESQDTNPSKKELEIITLSQSKPDYDYTETKEVGLASIPLKKRLLIILLFIVMSVAIIMGIAFLIRSIVFPTQIRIEKPQPIVVESGKNIEANSSSNTIANSPKDSIDTAFDDMKTNYSIPQNNKSTQNIENEIEKSVINNAQQKSTTTTTPTTKTSTTASNFYLIVGSFQDQKNAQKLHDELKQKNLNAIIIKRPNGTYAVSISSYTTKDEANAAKTKYSSSFPAAWIMSKPQ